MFIFIIMFPFVLVGTLAIGALAAGMLELGVPSAVVVGVVTWVVCCFDITIGTDVGELTLFTPEDEVDDEFAIRFDLARPIRFALRGERPDIWMDPREGSGIVLCYSRKDPGHRTSGSRRRFGVFTMFALHFFQ